MDSLERRVEVAEACRGFEQIGEIINGPQRIPIVAERRRVAVFDYPLAAISDAKTRGACMVLDLHHRWWSVPVELTLHQAHEEIVDKCLEGLIPIDFAVTPTKAA